MQVPSWLKILISIVILIITEQASAQWTLLPKSNQNAHQYIGKKPIVRTGQIARMIWLNDLAEPQSIRIHRQLVHYLSQIFEAEYDCASCHS